ncbi:SurA N-terminal domain-containing protein [Aidingimonas lacisalsi]|uniref:SurA N-terminal domain-containing protein n=1 Tax=Aidingimonas lacisalsi TaxID=2604086 RepID=UPI0011D18ABD|nr:SurA N-terminal domain-containing protein [Aidingimonas lacisalsi]
MLQRIREGSSSWGVKIIIGVVILAMALFGAESLLGLFGDDENEVAEVNGESIARQDLEIQVQRAMRSGRVPPEAEDEVRQELLNELITSTLLTQYAEEGGMALSDDQLDEVIVSLPEFQDDEGGFSSERFQQRLSQAGYTPNTFRKELRKDLQRRQLQQGLAMSDFSLSYERERLERLEYQRRSFRYHLLTPDDLEEVPEASDEDIEAYYEANQDAYRRPEQVQLAYVIVDRQRLADNVDVEEQALRDAYAERAEEADRRVSHIMLSLDEHDRAEAEEQLSSLRERIEEGESFADLAQEYSDDSASAQDGGDLGVITPGIFGDSFDDAAFSLEQDEVSGIVETDSGLHLLQVTDIDMPAFEELRDELRQEVAQARVEEQFNDKVQQLIDESFAADDLASVADSVGVPLETSDWVSRDGAEGVLSEPGVMDAAFSDDVLEEGYNSDVIELGNDRHMVVRVVDHRSATTLPLDDVRSEVASAVETQLMREGLRALANSRLDRLRQGESLNIDWQSVERVTRDHDAAPEAVVRGAFRLEVPADEESTYGQVATDESVALIALDSVEEGEVDEQSQGNVAQMAERLRAQAAIQGLSEHLREEATIER